MAVEMNREGLAGRWNVQTGLCDGFQMLLQKENNNSVLMLCVRKRADELFLPRLMCADSKLTCKG